MALQSTGALLVVVFLFLFLVVSVRSCHGVRCAGRARSQRQCARDAGRLPAAAGRVQSPPVSAARASGSQQLRQGRLWPPAGSLYRIC
mmetsp:Transcript_38558/g.69980  ORF Transcript_38558/g.69980 Transcript_38558/m.69980 type:complete len:88 (+) Transcript_38558:1547-1810(+)